MGFHSSIETPRPAAGAGLALDISLAQTSGPMAPQI
jgi:hypothetical protein